MKQILAILFAFALTCTAEAADTTRYVGVSCEVLANGYPLVDSTDDNVIETAVAHNTVTLWWFFQTPGGEVIETELTAGDFDWTHRKLGIYQLTFPADFVTRPGTGHFVGTATGVKPWRSPSIEFVEVKGQ